MNICDMLNNNLPAIVSGIGIIISLITFKISTDISNKREFIKTFDEIYKKTFSLRTVILKRVKLNEFHYEIDTILNNKEIEIIILDYITEIENLSIIIMHRNSHGKFPKYLSKIVSSHDLFNRFTYAKLFKKLSSPELYKRLLCLYPYIIYKQKETNNKELFSNYINLLSKIENEKMPKKLKIKRVYSGIRTSDIEFDKNYFDDDICIFGKKYSKSFQKYRANQNYNREDFTEYYSNRFKKLNENYINNNNKYQIMLYNQQNAYELSAEIRKNVICCNKEDILLILNDKIQMKQLLKNNNIVVPPFCVINGYNLNDQNIKNKLNCDEYIIQTTHGGGGIGTYLFNKSTLNDNLNKINKNCRYIVSKYISNSLSVNTHIFISDTSNLVLPGSIQLIEKIDNQLLYKGADFISYRDIPRNTREKIRILSIKIANILRKKGYKGVAGIDFIIDKYNKIYCSEINPRFQASSVVISKYLHSVSENNSMITDSNSIYKINEDAFNGITKSSISYYDEINYSCYFYYNDANLSKNDIDCKLNIIKSANQRITSDKDIGKSEFVCHVNQDSYNAFRDVAFNERSYLFRVIYENKISQISPDHTLWINDSVKLQNAPENKLKLKIALVNQGIRTIIGNDLAKIKKAVFNGVDFKIAKKGIYINSPMNIGFSILSPFEIKKTDNQFYLYYYTKRLDKVEIESEFWDGNNSWNNTDINLKDILYISTDRIRIKPINGCDLKSCGIGCKFCELKHSKTHYSTYEIAEALKFSKKLKYKHILIGGGTDLSPNSWDNIIEISKLIKRILPNKPISLMSIPAPLNKLNELHNAGIDEVAFNIEIYDKKTASYYMPGKRDNNFSLYYNTLKESVSIFGKGNVRSAFVVGLEKTDSLLYGIEKICRIGVIPCLSIYRPLSNTMSISNPTNEYLKFVYNEVSCIAEKYGLSVGPKCDACKNNMLAI